MVGTDDVEKLVGALDPTSATNRNDPQRWRVSIAIILGVTVVMNGFHILYACGWLAAFNLGMDGFARAQDVQQNQATLARKVDHLNSEIAANKNQIMATVISGQILGMYATECTARRSSNIALADNISQQLSDLQVKYSAFSGGQFYPLQPCP